MQNRPARAKSRLARLMDRPRAERDTPNDRDVLDERRKLRRSSARRVVVGPSGESLAQATRQDLQRIAARKAAAPG
jgi:hypothetical protein